MSRYGSTRTWEPGEACQACGEALPGEEWPYAELCPKCMGECMAEWREVAHGGVACSSGPNLREWVARRAQQ